MYLSLSLTNRDDIIANSYSLITSDGSVVDLLDAVQSSIVGLPPATLNTIEKLSTAISDDPNYFTTTQNAINDKVSTGTLATTVSTINTSVDTKIANLVGAAPALLNTLVEISTAIGNNENFVTSIGNALNLKAPLASPALTGTATAAALTVSGALLIGTTNVMTELVRHQSNYN